VFPGGHGTVWDVNQDRHARQLLLDAVAGDESVALVVCHAVGILAFTREADGTPLVEGAPSPASRTRGRRTSWTTTT